MIKNDSLRKERRLYALSLGCSGIVFLFVLVGLGLKVVTGQAAHKNLLSPLLLSILLLFGMGWIGMGWIGFLLLRFRRVDQRRTRALQGDQSLLAASQPVPDETALSLPTTLQLRPRRRYVLALSGSGSVIFMIVIFTNFPDLAITLESALVTFLIFTAIIYDTSPYDA